LAASGHDPFLEVGRAGLGRGRSGGGIAAKPADAMPRRHVAGLPRPGVIGHAIEHWAAGTSSPGDAGLIVVRLLLCLLFGAVLAVVAVSAQAAFVLPAWLPYGASVKLPAYAAIIVAACLAGLTATALIAGRAPQHIQGPVTDL